MSRPINDISGKRFGNLVAIKPAYTDNKKYLYWRCVCDCGNFTTSTSSDLLRGRNKVCKKCANDNSELSPIKTLYGNYKRGAKKRNLSFEITIDEFKELINKKCFYCGIEPRQFLKKKYAVHGVFYNGIDRKNNCKGYISENVVSCCKFCNFAKSRWSFEEFIDWLNRLKKDKI